MARSIEASRHGAPEPGGRLPDFVIIGTMKSGTTTLFSWLGGCPGVMLPTVKEPTFFSSDQNWQRGLSWYRSLFPFPGSAVTGEASVEYTDPDHASLAAERLAKTLPDARLICVLRDPVERLRSHYRHEVQRSRESRPFLDAIAEAGNVYVRRSLYGEALAPYLDRAPDRLLLTRMEELTRPPHTAWFEILNFIGVPSVPPPGTAINTTSVKPRFRRATLFFWEKGILDVAASLTPRPVRALGKRLLLTNNSKYRRLLASSQLPIPEQIEALVRENARCLQLELGKDLGF